MKKIAYVIIIIVSLALVPTGALAGSFSVFGVNVTVPDSYTSCAPANDIDFTGITGTGNTVEYWFYWYNIPNNRMVPIAHGFLSEDASVPFPYPSITGKMTFAVAVKVVKSDGTWLKGQAQWTVTCEPPPVIECEPPPVIKVYIPLISGEPSSLPCIQGFNATVGFEDLTIAGPNDYDFNDWITDIRGNLDYTGSPTCDLNKIGLTFIPQARGAMYDHTFHMLFPANTFLVDGTATLTIYDQNGDIVSSEQTPFDASADNDFTIFSRTSDVFPVMANTLEGLPLIHPRRTATLSIEFDTPAPFLIPTDTFDSPHGEKLFFDPYLFVINWAGSIHRGDFRLLSVPVASYLWPEETRAIYDVYYEGVQFVPGNPPLLNFIADWWLSLYNDCVFGDGVVCSLP